MMSLINEYNSKENLFYIEDGITWHVGTRNTVQVGIRHLLAYLDGHGCIIVEGPEIFDCVEGWGGEICYVILLKALPKLEYLAWKYKTRKRSK